MNRLSSIASITAVCGTVLSGATASGQLTYDISHTFTFFPPAGFPAVVPLVQGAYFQHAWIKEIGYQAWGASPLPQGPGFDPFGMETPTASGAANHSTTTGMSSPVNFQGFVIPPTGMFWTGCTTVTSPNSGLSASACNQFDIMPFGAGTPISGTFRSVGGLIMSGRRYQEAYAFSSAGLSMSGVSPAGQILWHATMASVSGGIHAIRVTSDPIIVEATDLAGNTASAVALDIDFENSGPGGVDWQSDVLTIDAPNSRFVIRMDQSVAPRGGDLIIETQNGAISSVLATGLFAGTPVPPIGSIVPFSMHLRNDIPVDYDANGILPGATSASLSFLGGGSMPGRTGDCRADFNGDGEVDFFDYLDFVDAFSAGSDAANFNNDEVVDFFDYLDFVDAFSAGC